MPVNPRVPVPRSSFVAGQFSTRSRWTVQPRLIALPAFVVAILLLRFTLIEAAVGSPPSLPDIRYHLTARPWRPLDTPRDAYLDRVEGVVRYEAALQSAGGAIIDPVARGERYYATPYFGNSLGVLLSAGRASDLLSHGVAAINHSSAQMASGNTAIPDQHGNFFIAPMADALSLYEPFIAPSQLATWQDRMKLPIDSLITDYDINWRTYAMKGQWYRYKQGLVSYHNAVSFIEHSWNSMIPVSQKWRFTRNLWNIYRDTSSNPDTFAYDAVSRANLWSMLIAGYDGASAQEMAGYIRRGTQSVLLLQDPTGQAALGGRSGSHTWNDVYSGLGFEMLAEWAQSTGDYRLAGQYRRAAMLALKSADRWRSDQGFYFVTKNRFDPALRVGYADYSQLATYNGNVTYHMSEAWRARQSAIAERPAPAEIGGYALEPDPGFGIAVANAGGMQLQANLRGTTASEYGRYWNALGIVRFSRMDWDSRLGPGDGIRDSLSELGVSYAPTFLESGDWVRLASVPERYEATFTSNLTHPLLVRARIDYAPRAGQSGPTFSDNLTITPDGVLSTIESSAPAGSFGVTWPILTNDGTPLTNEYTRHIASVSFPGGGDQQDFIALHQDPTLTANLAPQRSAYGDLRPVRMVASADRVQTFIYPRSPWDPSAENVRESVQVDGNNFASVLGRVEGSLYIGRTAAGGIGSAIDLDRDGTSDVTFGTTVGFILQLANGRITAIEVDRAVTANVRGRNLDLVAYTPVALALASTQQFEAESGTLANAAQVVACSTCSQGRRVTFPGSPGSVTFGNVNVPVAGNYLLTLYYSNQDAGARAAAVTVNGVSVPATFPSTGSWSIVKARHVSIRLEAGNNTIALGNGTGDAPWLDRIVLALSHEADASTVGGGAQVVADCGACSAGDRAGFLGNQGAFTGTLTFRNVQVPAAGDYVITLYYSNLDATARTATLSVNGVTGPTVAFPSTGGWTTMAPLDVAVHLDAGANTIAISNAAAKAPSFDRLVVHVSRVGLVATTLPAVVRETSATLSGSITPSELPTTAWFEWGITGAYGNATPSQVTGTGSGSAAITAALTGLSPGTAYHYRLVAVDADGTVRGSDATFTTNVLPPGGAGGGGGGGGGRAPGSAVGSSGGTVSSGGGSGADGGVSVTFSAGAVSGAVQVQLSVAGTAPGNIQAPVNATIIPKTIDVTTSPPVTLSAPVTLEINLTGSEVAAAGGSAAKIEAGVVGADGRVEILPTQLLPPDLLHVQVSHFSRFVLLVMDRAGPVLSGPSGGAQLTGVGDVTLSWSNRPGTTQYQIQVVPFNDDGPGIDLIRNVEDSYTVRAPAFGTGDPNYLLLPDMTYTWQVRTTTSAKSPIELTEGDWSDWASSTFRTGTVTSAAISRVSPQGAAIVESLTPAVQWSNANPEVFYYEVQLSSDPGFSSDPAAAAAAVYWNLVHGGDDSHPNSWTVPIPYALQPATAYYWRVRPRVQGDGTPVPWSDTWSFRTR